MEYKKHDRFKETYVEETLENGLHVVLWQKPEFEKSYFLMATPLGAFDIEQVDEEGNVITYPAGIAHFLEHKMFEADGLDVMERFSQLGANVNAFTSYQETCYYFSTSQDVEEPLNLLLDFVQELSISEESVEKEKGIIISELQMYEQMSDTALLMRLFRSLFHEHPMRFDIGGDVNSVNATTKQNLEDCYAYNYHPQKMILVGVSGKDPTLLMDIIRKNQVKKCFPTMKNVMRKQIEEPHTVVKRYDSFTMDVGIPKVAIAYKLAGIKDVMTRKRYEWAIALAMDAMFTTLNPQYQKWMDEEIINDYFGYEVDLGEDYGVVMIYVETWKEEQFLDLVKTKMFEMKETLLSQSLLEQLKRRYYGAAVRSLNQFDEIAISYMRSYFSGMDYFDYLELITHIEESDMKAGMQYLTLEDEAIVVLNPKKV